MVSPFVPTFFAPSTSSSGILPCETLGRKFLATGAPYLDPAEMAKSSRSVGLRERKRPEGCKALMDERRRGGPGRQCAGLSRIVDHSDGGALGTLPPNATLQASRLDERLRSRGACLSEKTQNRELGAPLNLCSRNADRWRFTFES